MILAAGRGERLRPLTDTIPKALVEVRGRSLLDYHLEALVNAGVKNAVINLGWHGEQIAARYGSGADLGLTIAYSPEGDNILETGGGIHRALPLLGREPFLVINADIHTDMPLPMQIADDADAHLVLVPKPAHRVHGDFDFEEGRVVNGVAPAWTFSGVAIYRPAFFANCTPGRFPLAPMLRAAADAGRLGGETWQGTWEDVGTPERLDALNRQAR